MPLLLLLLNLSAPFTVAIYILSFVCGISCAFAFAAVPYLFVENQNLSIFKVFSLSTKEIRGKKLKYIGFMLVTAILPALVTVTIHGIMIIAFPKTDVFVLVQMVVSSLVTLALTSYMTIAAAGYFSDDIKKYSEN